MAGRRLSAGPHFIRFGRRVRERRSTSFCRRRVVVVGETPYAEGVGDIGNGHTADLSTADKAAVDKVCAAMKCAVLIVSAHWENAPLTIGATRSGTPLIYDFGGFPERYYRAQYRSPGAPELAADIRRLLSDQPVAEEPDHGLDHGAYVPLTVMYPDADVPVLQVSMPSLDPEQLFEIGRRLRPLRDQGVLVIGSGFLTHGLPFLRDFRLDAPPPAWSTEFDAWAHEALDHGDVDALSDFMHRAPAVRYAHPRTEHLAPLFVTLGAGDSTLPQECG